MVKLLASERKKVRFNLHVIAYLCTEFPKQLFGAIMSHVDESTQFANLRVIERIGLATGTYTGKTLRFSMIPHCD
jgi:hypothetical protein